MPRRPIAGPRRAAPGRLRPVGRAKRADQGERERLVTSDASGFRDARDGAGCRASTGGNGEHGEAATRDAISLGAINAALNRELAAMEEEIAAARREVEAANASGRALEARILEGEERLRAALGTQETRAALLAERAELFYGLRMPGAPRALRLVLPLARVLRAVLRAGRAAPERPPPMQPAATDPVLARSVEAGLLTLALRAEAWRDEGAPEGSAGAAGERQPPD